MKESFERKKSKDFPQILVILSATLSGVSYGTCFSWPSPSVPILISDKDNYDITIEEASYLSVIPSIAAIITSPIFGRAIDTVGRKRTILFMAIPHFTFWILVAFTKSIWIFYLARCVSGIADACIFATLPIYISEISTPKVRGTWGNVMQFGMFFGQMFVSVIGGILPIQTTAFICSVFPVMFVVTFAFAPESPYYHLMKGRIQEAQKSLQKLRGIGNVDDELEILKADVSRQISEAGTWKHLFGITSNRKALYAAIFLRIAQQLSGPIPFFVYNQYFFEKAGGDLSATTSSTIFYGSLVLMNVFASCMLDRLGRRWATIISLFICCLVLYLETVYFYISDNVDSIDITYLNWIPLFGLVIYIISFQIGLGIVPTLVLGELFSQSIKGKACCVLNVVMNVGVCLTSKLFQVMESILGLYAPFAFFAICSTVNVFLAYYLVPETKGKTLEEIQQKLKGKTKSKVDVFR